MTADYETELRWAGWRAMAAAAFNLRPAEAHALALLRRRAGMDVPIRAFAEFVGQTNSGEPGSDAGVRKRIERVRARLNDVGCGDIIATVTDTHRARAFRLERAGSSRLDHALRCACGLESRLAAP